MTAATRNEAAERLRPWLRVDGWIHAPEDVIVEALAAERRATVERIRERISERGFAGQDWVRSVLDEEAAR